MAGAGCRTRGLRVVGHRKPRRSPSRTFPLADPLAFDHPDLAAHLPEEEWLAALRRALRSTSREARIAAARALRRAGDRNAVPALLEFRRHGDIVLRSAAGGALPRSSPLVRKACRRPQWPCFTASLETER